MNVSLPGIIALPKNEINILFTQPGCPTHNSTRVKSLLRIV